MAEAIGLGDGCQASFFLDVRRFEMSVRDFRGISCGFGSSCVGLEDPDVKVRRAAESRLWKCVFPAGFLSAGTVREGAV
jgi:hypothetical protein